MPSLYTRRGDTGDSDVGGGRQRKDAPILEAVGAIDEANAAVGAAVTELEQGGQSEADILRAVQADLFALGADLAWPASGVTLDADRVEWLERRIDASEAALTPLANFVLPGGSRGAAALHVSRTVVRRAERCVVALARGATTQPSPAALPYLNRLGDLLFSLARLANQHAGVAETPWSRPGAGQAGEEGADSPSAPDSAP